jgi:orotidine-5'-phosphate decarboxylase
VAASFGERWTALREERTSLVLGVQPSAAWLRAWSLRDDLRGAADFCDVLLTRAVGRVAAVKIQAPFFERFGPAGLTLLAAFVERSRELGTLTIVDAKRGDADDTMPALAAAYLGPSSWLGADAVTVVAYMGFDSLRPLCEAAVRSESAVFVVVRTSGHAADPVQRACSAGNGTVAEWLGGEIAAANAGLAPGVPIGPVGAVVGAPPGEARALVARARGALVSLPGLGREGRTLAHLEAAAGDAAARVLLPITSGLLRDGPAGLRASVERWQRAIRASALGVSTRSRSEPDTSRSASARSRR